MRISDWSSDVCSSDLKRELVLRRERLHERLLNQIVGLGHVARQLPCKGAQRREDPDQVLLELCRGMHRRLSFVPYGAPSRPAYVAASGGSVNKIGRAQCGERVWQ